MKIYLIAAVAKNGVIGNEGKIPWHFPEDLKRFKRLTSGHAIIMGRKTYESIGRPLPQRRNLVLTRQNNLELPPGGEALPTLEEALQLCRERQEEKVFVIGGGEIYARAFPLADGLYLTYVDQEVEGDTFFPSWDKSQWEETQRESLAGLTYVDYERKR